MSPRANIPTVLIIFGVTGDLMAKKIAPALFHLFQKKSLPGMFRIIGFGRRDFTDEEFAEYLDNLLRKYTGAIPEQGGIGSFASLCTYHRGAFGDPKSYTVLAQTIKKIDASWGVCSNKLFHLAVPPDHYETIFENLSSSGLTQTCGPYEGWTRVIVEKPFGKDFETAERLDLLLASLFQEVQIYRIDHYLAKEMLQNILSFRFSNNLFEQSWNNNFIERIDIRFLETLDVQDRGAFYDSVGALRDVGQNHMLQMLALITLEHPKNFDAQAIRAKRAEILAALRTPTAAAIAAATNRAQYASYHTTRGVAPESSTETYFKIPAHLDTPRWQGVEIVLEGGKFQPEVKKEIEVTFKHPSPCLCPPGAQEHYKNRVVFALEPQEKISLHMWTKKPGLTYDMQETVVHLGLRDKTHGAQFVEEYEKLLLDCIAGDQTLFVSTDEVKSMWRFIDPIVSAWEKNTVPLRIYPDGETD